MGFNTKMFGRLIQIHSKKNHNTWIAPTAGDSTGTFLFSCSHSEQVSGRQCGASAAKTELNFLRQPSADTSFTFEGGFQATTGQLLIVTIDVITTFTIKNTCRTGHHVLCPPRLPGRGGTGHTMHSRARGGEGSFCGAGAAYIFPKTPLYFSQKSIGRYLTQVTSVITL